MMKNNSAYYSKVEVNGGTVLSILNAMGEYRNFAEGKLRDKGISDLVANDWYNLETWIEAIGEISNNIGDEILYVAGRKTTSGNNFFEDQGSLEKALGAIDVVYNKSHRGEDAGYCKLAFFDGNDKFARVECRNPYPKAFNKGVISMITNWFNEENTQVSVEIDRAEPADPTGKESFYYNVFW